MEPPDTRDIMISCRHVASGYGSKPLMSDINFDIRRGEIVFILGGSGCGKSTLLRHMIGQVPQIGGTILIKGVDIAAARGAERDALRRVFGVMYQSGALFGNLSVLDNVLLPLEEFTDLPAPLRLETARLWLARVGLLPQASMMPADLSGGMKKRAAIARAMALDPEILFLDEPGAGLDPVTSARLDSLILSLSRDLGMTVVIISHELASIEAIADRAVYLDRSVNGVLDAGPPAWLRDESPHAAVRAFFNRRPD